MTADGNAPVIRSESDRIASSISWRVFIGTAAIVIVVVLVALVTATSAARRSADATARRNLEQAADLVAQLLAGRERSLAGGAQVFVQGPYFRTLVAEHRRDDILDQTFEAAAQLKARWVFITDASGMLLAKSDEPSAGGDQMGHVPLVAGALRGQVNGGFGASGDTLLFQATAVPIALPSQAPVGVLVATSVIDSSVAADIKSATASEVVFYVLDTTGMPHVVTSTVYNSPELQSEVRRVLRSADAALNTDRSISGIRPDMNVGDTAFIDQASSLATAGGAAVGGFLVLRNRDAALVMLAGVRRSLIFAGVLGLLLALLAAWLATRSVTRPVRVLAAAIRRAAEGNYSSPTLNNGEGDGEIGSLARAFDALLVDLRDKDSLSASTAAAIALDESRRVETSSADTSTGSRAGRMLSLNVDTAVAGVDVQRGRVLASRYHIESLIGSGGMGNVYRAHDRILGETIAIKLLRPEIVGFGAMALDHLRQELRVARRITHRNVVRTHDIGESDGIPFLTMEYIEGASLWTVIRIRGSLPVSAMLSLARQLMRALAAAHSQSVVHGDIKPQNLLIGPSGVLKVTDFGVARMIRTAQQSPHVLTPVNDDVSGRLGGAIVGTPEYLAPELLIGGASTVAADLYAAGIVLHECLVGTTPFGADTPMAFFANKLTDTHERATRPPAAVAAEARAALGIPADVDSLIAQLTDPDPQKRPASAAEVLARLSSPG